MNSRPETLLSLEQFARIMSIDPFFVAGWCVGDLDTGCDCRTETWVESGWQGQFVARAELAEAIRQAETMVALELGYWPAPIAIVAEGHKYPAGDSQRRSYTGLRTLAHDTMIQKSGRKYKSVTLHWGKVQAIGKYVDTPIGDTETITYNDSRERFAATIELPAEPVGDEEYLIYFRAEDRADTPYEGETESQWQVRNVHTSVTESGGVYTLTIKGDSYLLMSPGVRSGRKWECKSFDAPANFVTSLAVVSRRLDSTDQGTLQWREKLCRIDCGDETVKAACFDRDDSPLIPIVRPKPYQYNAETSAWASYQIPAAPRWATVNYICGEPLINGEMNPRYARVVAYLAASLLERKAADCDCAGNRDALEKYRDLQKVRLTETDTANSGVSITGDRVVTRPHQIESPWGGRYGAVLAWNLVQSIKQHESEVL